jgi:methylated-DNA-protein-cysteine methyltransferase-like protein
VSDRDCQIIDVIRALVPGEVVSYGDIAEVAGAPGRSRLVGHLLATTVDDLPWWRVVNAAGRLVPGNELEQAALLREEAVTIRDDKVRDAPFGRFSRPRS